MPHCLLHAMVDLFFWRRRSFIVMLSLAATGACFRFEQVQILVSALFMSGGVAMVALNWAPGGDLFSRVMALFWVFNVSHHTLLSHMLLSVHHVPFYSQRIPHPNSTADSGLECGSVFVCFRDDDSQCSPPYQTPSVGQIM